MRIMGHINRDVYVGLTIIYVVTNLVKVQSSKHDSPRYSTGNYNYYSILYGTYRTYPWDFRFIYLEIRQGFSRTNTPIMTAQDLLLLPILIPVNSHQSRRTYSSKNTVHLCQVQYLLFYDPPKSFSILTICSLLNQLIKFLLLLSLLVYQTLDSVCLRAKLGFASALKEEIQSPKTT